MTMERIMAGFMRYGAFASIGLTAGGSLLLLTSDPHPIFSVSERACPNLCMSSTGAILTLLGLMMLILVSIGRLLLCSVLFLSQDDTHMARISMGTVLLVLASALFRLLS